MAVINIYDDNFTEICDTIEINEKKSLKDILHSYVNSKNDNQTVEVYDPETGKTEFIELEIQSYNAAIVVNGEEKDIDYVVNTDDVCTVCFFPKEGKSRGETVGNVLGGTGAGLMVAGLITAIFVPPVGAIIMAVGAGLGIVGSIIKDTSAKKRIENETVGNATAGDSEGLLGVKGGSNEALINTVYPLVLGKHLVNPKVVGSSYHVSKSRSIGDGHKYDHADIGQWYQSLFEIDYAPVKVTDFKLGETFVSYNRYNEANNVKDTVIHGKLKGSDILPKWKNNDVEIEILQAGSFISEQQKYGTIYPVTVLEDEIEGGNILYAYDKLLGDVQNIQYKGVAIPWGTRTNSIRYSKANPYRIEVELDMPSGCFATYEDSSSNASRTYYKDIPINVAVQYRFANANSKSYDGESAGDWKTFDYELLFDKNGNEVQVKPIVYGLPTAQDEIKSNKGLTEGTAATQNQGWYNQKVFSLTSLNGSYVPLTSDEITQYINMGVLQEKTYSYTEYTFSHNSKLTGQPVYKALPKKEIKHYVKLKDYPNLSLGESTTFRYTGQNGNIRISDPYYLTPVRYASSSNTYTKDNFNLNERRFTFVKEFSQDELIKIIGDGNKEPEFYSSVEVRVVRLTPCYLNQNNSKSETISNESYEDLVKWTYLRTWVLDVEKYKEAIKLSKTDNKPLGYMPDTGKVDPYSYPMRPQSSEDMDRFCYVALRLKQDVAETGGSSLQKFNCIVQSLNPKYDMNHKLWSPVFDDVKEEYKQLQIISSYNYFYTDFDENGIKRINALPLDYDDPRSLELGFVKIDEETGEYIDYLENGFTQYEVGIKTELAPMFFKKKNGTSFLNDLRTEVIISGDRRDLGRESCYPNKGVYLRNIAMENFYLSDEMCHKYETSNVSSVAIMSLIGNHLKGEAKDFDRINLDKFAELYEFCNDVTDGTKEEYSILNEYNTTLNLTSPKRVKTSDEMGAWNTKEGSYSTYFSSSYWYDVNGNPVDRNPDFILEVTPILDDGTVITEAQLSAAANKIAKGETPAHNVFLAKNYSEASSNAYTEILHDIGDLYYDPNKEYENETVEGINVRSLLLSLANKPINSVIRGCYDHILELIMLYFEIPFGQKYMMYNVLEQFSLPQNTYKVCAESDGKLHIQFNCNGIVSSALKLEDLLAKILVTGRSYYKRGDGDKYEPVIGKPIAYPVTVLNQRNVISKQNNRSFEETISGFQVYVEDENDGYETNDFYVMDDGENAACPSKRIEEFRLPYVTSILQMRSLARFNLACKLYQKESYSRTIGFIGYNIGFGDLVLLQDDSLLVGTDRGGRIKELIQDQDRLYGFITDEPFEYTGELKDDLCIQGCTVVQPAKFGNSRCATLRIATPEQFYEVDGVLFQMKKGLTNLVLFDSPVLKDSELLEDSSLDGEFYTYNPQLDDLVAFGHIDSIFTKAVVMAVKPKDKQQFELTLAPYNEELYNYGEKLPFFRSNMTTPKREESQYNFKDYQTTSERMEEQSNNMTRTMDMIDVGSGKKEPDDIVKLDIIANNSDYLSFIPVISTSGPNNNISSYIYEAIKSAYLKAKLYDETKEYYISTPDGYIKAEPQPTAETFNNEVYYTYDVSQNWTSINLAENRYYFNRDTDGYPEADELSRWKFRVKAVNVFGLESQGWCES